MARELEAMDWSFLDKRFVIFLNERWLPRDLAAKCWLQMLPFEKTNPKRTEGSLSVNRILCKKPPGSEAQFKKYLFTAEMLSPGWKMKTCKRAQRGWTKL